MIIKNGEKVEVNFALESAKAIRRNRLAFSIQPSAKIQKLMADSLTGGKNYEKAEEENYSYL